MTYQALQLHHYIQLMMTIDADTYKHIRTQFYPHDMHKDKEMIEALAKHAQVFPTDEERDAYVGYCLSTQYTLYELQQFYYAMKQHDIAYWEQKYTFYKEQQ